MKCKILIDILLLFGVVYLFSMCSNNRNVYNDNNTTHTSYTINHYIDTISGHIILTTVCDDASGSVSLSTLELNNK